MRLLNRILGVSIKVVYEKDAIVSLLNKGMPRRFL